MHQPAIFCPWVLVKAHLLVESSTPALPCLQAVCREPAGNASDRKNKKQSLVGVLLTLWRATAVLLAQPLLQHLEALFDSILSFLVLLHATLPPHHSSSC